MDEFRRLIIKQGEGAATTPPSADHRNGDWIETDVYVSEWYMDIDDDQLYIKGYSGTIYALPMTPGVDTNFANTDLTFTGDRAHDTAGFQLGITTDGGIGAEAAFEMASTYGYFGFDDNYFQVDSSGFSFSTGATAHTLDSIGFVTGGAVYATEIGISSEYTLPLTDGSAGQVMQTDGAGNASWTTVAAGLTVGTTSIASGTVGHVLFQGSGNVLQENASLFWDNANIGLGVGATPNSAVVLDVRHRGNTSATSAFRVRNSANTYNNFIINGDDTFILGKGSLDKAFQYLNDGRLFMAEASGNFIELNPSTTNNRLFGGNHGWEISTSSAAKVIELRTASTALQVYGGGVQLANGLNAADGTNVFSITSGTAPTGNYGDSFKLYSADIVAGNAAPHFRTENSDIVKIYSIGGWGTPTGTLTRTTYATFAGQTISAIPTQAEVQAIDDHVKVLSERLAAALSDLKTGHQLFKA